jgi:hypothetical protein
LLPENERGEYRRRLLQRIFSVRLEDGTWNDRVFPRSASFGTASVMIAILSKDMPRPVAWVADTKQASAEPRP